MGRRPEWRIASLWTCGRSRPVLLTFACLLLMASCGGAQEIGTKRVLVFTDGGLSAPAMNLANQNIHDVLEAGLPYRIEYYTENLAYSLFPE